MANISVNLAPQFVQIGDVQVSPLAILWTRPMADCLLVKVIGIGRPLRSRGEEAYKVRKLLDERTTAG
jgi:hypothetical protein